MSALFCDTDLARRIEGAEAGFITAALAAAQRRTGGTGFAMPVAGGVAGFAEPDSPWNKVAGLGFAGVPDEDELARIEDAFAERGAAVQVELSNLADPAVGELLTGRGYRLASYENVLGLLVSGGDSERVTPPGVQVRPSGDDEFDVWLEVILDAVAHPDTEGLPWLDDFPRQVVADAERDIAATGARRYLALVHGVPAGGASMGIRDGIASFSAGTAPAFRRRGVQSALLAARLADAAADGCELAVVTTQPGSPSQRNVQRRGFELLYTRAVLIR
ncbi:GNAT family N-acetyltransferase [Dactylosporangium matsuzakiense]|uniref:GNAT family acetyltransferase n=1 Tax=Dactylosporangium matsuzakiense TaxID=53360 RepID=A0A9W6NTQ3_9ACTN|nr:GNAT family N-acetyltransferase [Dactylosporangium matsuzakiense]UWZ41181.1 GNAT family N-acetyltransferase [Dactylosporangium matsuzakiense]GLL08472.1 GNAT family acetyltransferase [Dactylosporangium matsuzakiense]